MLSIILVKKIFSLFLILGAGVILVKTKILKTEDSRILSTVCLYMIMPCTILSSFQVKFTAEVAEGIRLAFIMGFLLNALLILLAKILKAFLKLDPVEELSVSLPNAGNLIYPLVTALMGKEAVIYASVFMMIQTTLIWTYGKMTICGERRLELKKIFQNINIICIISGCVIMLTGFHFPAPIQDTLDMGSGMIGPVAMLVTGMLIGGADLKKMMQNMRMWMVIGLRLIAVPLIVIVILKLAGMERFASNGEQVVMISLLPCLAPSASSITQLSQVYGRNAQHASAINMIGTLLCIITMPLMVALYQL